MLEELTAALETCQADWNNLVATAKNQEYFVSLKPTAAAWKTKDLADFTKRFNVLRDSCDQIHLGWINERWIATFHLKDAKLPWGLRVLKLMQRRPGSSDAVGLDHIDFYIPPGSKTAKEIMQNEAMEWSEEKNGDHCRWISVWFEGTEAKLRSDTVLGVCAEELKDAEKLLLS